VVQCVSDGELMVKVGDQLWPLNSKCCILQPNGRPDTNNTLAASNNCVLNHAGKLCCTYVQCFVISFMLAAFLLTLLLLMQSNPVNSDGQR